MKQMFLLVDIFTDNEFLSSEFMFLIDGLCRDVSWIIFTVMTFVSTSGDNLVIHMLSELNISSFWLSWQNLLEGKYLCAKKIVFVVN
jgi:hypothetical protein